MELPQFFIHDFGMDTQMVYVRARTSMEVCMSQACKCPMSFHVHIPLTINSRDAEEQSLSCTEEEAIGLIIYMSIDAQTGHHIQEQAGLWTPTLQSQLKVEFLTTTTGLFTPHLQRASLTSSPEPCSVIFFVFCMTKLLVTNAWGQWSQKKRKLPLCH